MTRSANTGHMFYAAPVWGTISPQLLVHRQITIQPYDKLLHQQLKKKKPFQPYQISVISRELQTYG